jgi:CDP-diacylglycerol---serine O-phosphatidyltransferase
MNTVKRALPGILTLSGLFMAFWSLALTADGRYVPAVWAVFVAGLCDTFDGTLARALGVISPFGRQLDSLVDLVAAGAAPALLIYRVYFERWGFVGTLFGFAWVALVALRLARFNTSPPSEGVFFVGVPCPIAASIVTQYLLFCRATWDSDGAPWICAGLVIVLGALMLSNVAYWKSATLLPTLFLRYPYGPGTAVVLLGLIPFPRQSLFVGTSISVFAATVRYGIVQARTTRVSARHEGAST